LDIPEIAVELRTTLVGFKEQARPGGTVCVTITVPLKPLMAVNVIVEFASRFASTVALVRPATTLKSTPETVTVVEADNDGGDVPVTVITSLPV
jgi:hypothetical protein